MATSIGIDVGSGVVKTALFRVENGKSDWLARWDAFRQEKLKSVDNLKKAS